MLARTVSIFALVLSASCAPAARYPTFSAATPTQSEQAKEHHTKISPAGAAGLTILGAALTAFAGVIFFVVPQRVG